MITSEVRSLPCPWPGPLYPCSFPPALQLHTTLHSDHSTSLPGLTRISGLAHAHMRICQSATAMPGLSIRGTPLSLPPVFRTPPSRARLASWTIPAFPHPRLRSPPHRTAFENNAASPTPHAPRSSVFVPSSSAGVAAPCRFSTAGHRDPTSMQAQANNAIDAYSPPSETLQNLSWSVALVLLCRFCVRTECVVVD